MESIDQKLRRIIRADGRQLSAIARDSKTQYMGLWSWYTGRQAKLDFVQAEKIHRTLTGKGFGE